MTTNTSSSPNPDKHRALVALARECIAAADAGNVSGSHSLTAGALDRLASSLDAHGEYDLAQEARRASRNLTR